MAAIALVLLSESLKSSHIFSYKSIKKGCDSEGQCMSAETDVGSNPVEGALQMKGNCSLCEWERSR